MQQLGGLGADERGAHEGAGPEVDDDLRGAGDVVAQQRGAGRPAEGHLRGHHPVPGLAGGRLGEADGRDLRIREHDLRHRHLVGHRLRGLPGRGGEDLLPDHAGAVLPPVGQRRLPARISHHVQPLGQRPAAGDVLGGQADGLEAHVVQPRPAPGRDEHLVRLEGVATAVGLDLETHPAAVEPAQARVSDVLARTGAHRGPESHVDAEAPQRLEHVPAREGLEPREQTVAAHQHRDPGAERGHP